jgi:hypothetical protein
MRNFRGVQGGLVPPTFRSGGDGPPTFSPPYYKKCRQNDVVCVLCRTVGQLVPLTFQTKVTPLHLCMGQCDLLIISAQLVEVISNECGVRGLQSPHCEKKGMRGSILIVWQQQRTSVS